MDAISYSYADKQAKRIKKFIENPDSSSGVVTVPSTIASGETITVPIGRTAVLPNLEVNGTLVTNGTVFIPSGGTFTSAEVNVDSGIFGTIQTQGMHVTPFGGLKNILMNGGFGVWQRGSSVSTVSLNTLTYCADRWYIYATGANITATQDVPLAGGSVSSIKVTGSAGNTQALLGQRIEDLNCLGLVENPSIVSFMAKASTSKTLYYSISYASGDVNNNWSTFSIIKTGSVNLTTTEQKFTIDVPYSANAYKGVRIEVWCQLGASETFNISTVQWEIGNVSTPFEQRPYGLELNLCQRYYETGFESNGAGCARFIGNTSSGSVYAALVNYKVKKRVTPTVVLSNIFVSGFNTTTGTIRGDMNGFVEDRTANATISAGTFISGYTASAEL